jgi:protein SCO1
MAVKSGKKNGAETASSPRKLVLLALLVGLAAGIMTAVLLAIVPEPATQQQTTGKAAIGGPFALKDGAGKVVTEKDFAGKPMLVFFGFTHCPDVCPAGLQVIAAALDGLGGKVDRMTPVFITVDPERDTPEIVDKYVKSFHKAIVGLSGTPEEVGVAVKAYRVYARKVPDAANPGEYNVDHSPFIYLMDGKGEFVKHFSHGADAAVLTAEVARVIDATPPASP